MTKSQVRKLWKQAETAALAAADQRLAELRAQGPAWAVVEHENMLDDSSPVKHIAGYMLDVCGFAWLHFSNCNRKPTCTLVNHLKSLGVACKSSYYGGYTANVPDRNRQEISVREAAARAAADVLQAQGIDVYAQSRVD